MHVANTAKKPCNANRNDNEHARTKNKNIQGTTHIYLHAVTNKNSAVIESILVPYLDACVGFLQMQSNTHLRTIIIHYSYNIYTIKLVKNLILDYVYIIRSIYYMFF